MKLILLDIDGVLNSSRSFAALGASWPPEHPDGSPGTEDWPRLPNLDPVAVGLVARLCRETGASVYVHSSWATRRRSADYFRVLFKDFYGWDAPVVEHTGNYGLDRANSIQDAIDCYEPEAYVILDDADLKGAFFTRHVCPVYDEGLSFDDFRRACGILGVPVPAVLA